MDRRAFDDLLETVRLEVERRLEERWSRKLRAVQRHGKGVAAMVDAARDLTMRGGKRFRAALLTAAYVGVAPKGRLDVAFDAGVALELLQSYLLMQDDWMDRDRTRRGGPSVHAALARALGSERLGSASAVLASDFTWGFALETLAGVAAKPERRLAAVELLVRIHEDVVVGQQLDVLGHADDVEAMHALKTGSYTVRGPLALGATLGGAKKSTLVALDRYAAPLGVAFQLRDDLLGAFGHPAQTGKRAFGDLREGKRTAVLLEAERRLDASGRRALAAVLGQRGAPVAAFARATRMLIDSGVDVAVAKRLGVLCDRAAVIAARLPLTSRSRAMLAGAADAMRWNPPSGHAARPSAGWRRTA